MRRNFIILLALALSFSGYAQKKPKINKANQAREAGDLAEAKSIIDAAIEHEKTKDDGKTWYYRGLIYATIDTTSNEQYASLSDNALEEAMKAFQKADEIDPEGKGFYTSNDFGIPVLKDQQISNYYSYYYNKAVIAFQNSEYTDAVANFENSYLVLPSDTNAYVNAAFAAHSGNLIEEAQKNYKLALEKGAKSKDLYYNYISLLNGAVKDKEAALDLVNQALDVYPKDGDLQKNRINLLIELDKVDEAKANLEEAIKAEPDNANLLFTLGVLNDQVGDIEGAKNAYERALKVDPNHYESNFNYGVMLINEANEVIKESNHLGMSKADQKKAAELEPIIIQKLKDARPQWEKINEVSPGEKTVLETLLYIYTQLKLTDKAKEISAELDSME